MDMPYAVAMWGALWWFWRSEDSSGLAPASPRLRWIGFYVLCAVGTLFKGPVALVLPGAIVGLYLLLSGRPRRVFELIHPLGILLYFLIAAPWFVVISLREPAYAYEFFIRQHIARYASTNAGHPGMPGVLLVPILLAGFIPWTLFLVGACIRYFPRRWRLRTHPPGTFLLWLSFLVPFVFFSFSEKKLAHYILPAFPPLAVLMGGVVAGWISPHEAGRPSRSVTVSLFAAALLLVPTALATDIYLGTLSAWIALPAAVAALAVVGMLLSYRRGRRGACFAWAAAAVVTSLLYIAACPATELYEQMSTRTLAKFVDPALAPTAKFCCWDTRKLSFVYYTGSNDVERFRHDTPGDLEKLVELLKSARTVYCLVCDKQRLDELSQACPESILVLGESGARWIIMNRRRPPPGG
jgi:4-amino-4-deoxy-L-arabinose transferase-like glycosyltransferase